MNKTLNQPQRKFYLEKETGQAGASEKPSNWKIMFSGKRVDNGKWVRGYYAVFEERHFIYTGEKELLKVSPVHGIMQEQYKAIEIIPGTVGQYTGLVDKNDTCIFEGDIIEYHDFMYNFSWNQVHVGVVEWRDNAARFRCTRVKVDGKLVKPEVGLFPMHFDSSGIIGNIHDNIELLTGKQ